ncbi:MAG: hypothetical protein AB1714_30675 [Acidobacteriota bacterium]
MTISARTVVRGCVGWFLLAFGVAVLSTCSEKPAWAALAGILLAALISEVHAQGRSAVLADSWEPYCHIKEQHARFGFGLHPCGPGVTVTQSTARPAGNGAGLTKPIGGVTDAQDR